LADIRVRAAGYVGQGIKQPIYFFAFHTCTRTHSHSRTTASIRNEEEGITDEERVVFFAGECRRALAIVVDGACSLYGVPTSTASPGAVPAEIQVTGRSS
jgi:hypothetical protein